MKMIYEYYTRRSYDEPINKTGKTPVKAIHYIMSFADSEHGYINPGVERRRAGARTAGP